MRADLYVFDGAAMILAYGADRPTRDIDAKSEPHGPVLQAAHEVADRLGLPRSRLKTLLGELEGLYAARRGDYRVIYAIDEEARVLVVHRVQHRRDVYRPR